MSPTNKSCQCCGKEFTKRKRDSQDQWEKREFCSVLCSNRSKKQPTSAHERFWNYVPDRVPNACWEWSGSLDRRGYGTIATRTGLSPEKAHRISWEIHFGQIPYGLNVCHACDNPACVNPNHLLLGTHTANALDMSRKGRMNASSLLNLHPGERGVHGAGRLSKKEIINGIG